MNTRKGIGAVPTWMIAVVFLVLFLVVATSILMVAQEEGEGLMSQVTGMGDIAQNIIGDIDFSAAGGSGGSGAGGSGGSGGGFGGISGDFGC